ncbi:MAG: hypothetical protein WKF30_19250, partial [Pyrinomonadaceae bacterium]
MKQCHTCQESFADKFGFCPVDGTPLNAHIPSTAAVGASSPVGDPSITENAGSTFAHETSTFESVDPDALSEETVSIPATEAMVEREEYHVTMLEDTGLVRRLSVE